MPPVFKCLHLLFERSLVETALLIFFFLFVRRKKVQVILVAGVEPGPKDRKSSALSIAPIGSLFRKPNFACQTFKRFEVSEKFANKEIQECATCKHQKCETSVRNQRKSFSSLSFICKSWSARRTKSSSSSSNIQIFKYSHTLVSH